MQTSKNKRRSSESVIAEKIIKKFLKKYYSFLDFENLEIKKRELFIGCQRVFKRGNKSYLVTRFPEGVLAVIDERGNFRDLSELDNIS